MWIIKITYKRIDLSSFVCSAVSKFYSVLPWALIVMLSLSLYHSLPQVLAGVFEHVLLLRTFKAYYEWAKVVGQCCGGGLWAGDVGEPV